VSERPRSDSAAHWPASRHGELSQYGLLADTVVEHRRAGEGSEPRKRDEHLYRRLKEIERSLPLSRLRSGGA
jgi:hypothetical protein